MEAASNYSICVPARFCSERKEFETINIIVDIENDRIELISEDKARMIRLDLIGANELRTVLQGLSDGKRYQAALGEKIEEHTRRYNTVDRTDL